MNLNDKFEYRIKLLLLLGCKCEECNETLPAKLELDHIDNDGVKDRLILRDIQLYKYYLNNPEEAKKKLRILCKEHHLTRHQKRKDLVALHTEINKDLMLKFKQVIIRKYGKLKGTLGLELENAIILYLNEEEDVDCCSLPEGGGEI